MIKNKIAGFRTLVSKPLNEVNTYKAGKILITVI